MIAQKVAPEGTRYGDVAVFGACTVMPATMLEKVGFRDAISFCVYEPMAEAGSSGCSRWEDCVRSCRQA